MRRHRTTARGVLLILAIGLFAGSAAAHNGGLGDGEGGSGPITKPQLPPKAKPAPKNTRLFPLIGPVQRSDDFGAARGAGCCEEGNDLMTPRKSLVVAVEAGRVKFWTDSGAGCMLYLYGKSGTLYEYLHMNNDLTAHNDNRGRCAPGVSYAPGLRSGAKVAAGQLLGLSGDSGNADGIPHLEFQIRPHGGRPVDPYRYLNRARMLMFTTVPGKFKLSVKGKVVSAGASANDPYVASVKVKLQSVRVYPGGYNVPGFGRTITVSADDSTTIQQAGAGPTTAAVQVPFDSLTSAKKGRPLLVKTAAAKQTLDARLGRVPLAAASVTLLPKK